MSAKASKREILYNPSFLPVFSDVPVLSEYAVGDA
jgi:hypothetical protein